MEEKINLIISQLGELRIKRDISLDDYTQFGNGKLASAIYIATSVSELIKAVNLCKELKVAFVIIGSGSKVKISNSEFLGLVIKNRSQNLKIFGIKGKVSRSGIGIEEAFIEADSGVNLDDLASFSEKQGLEGFDGLKLVKGTVGGSISSDQILQGKVTQIIVLDNLDSEKTKESQELSDKDVILRAIFHLKAREV
jgi:UDP-N-acetylenolpyruvoylglucosamine reductase